MGSWIATRPWRKASSASFARKPAGRASDESPADQHIAIDFVIEPLEKRGEPDAESTDVQWIPFSQLLSLDLAFDHMDSVRSYLDARRQAVATPILI